MNTITTVRNRITVATTVAFGAGAIAIGALALSASASAATSIQPTCVDHPNLYAEGATLAVYSTQKRGFDSDQICKVYDPGNTLLGVYTTTDYGYYKLATPVPQPPVLSTR
jgi:hypothetical protein